LREFLQLLILTQNGFRTRLPRLAAVELVRAVRESELEGCCRLLTLLSQNLPLDQREAVGPSNPSPRRAESSAAAMQSLESKMDRQSR
jgi:hypothetical protein